MSIETTVTLLKTPNYSVQLPPQRSESFFRCATATSIILFLLINLGSFFAAQFYGRHKNKSCDNIISTFENIKQRPNVVLLGSSLMRMPFYLSDIEHSYTVPRYEQYCWNRTLQNMLNISDPERNVVFDLAIDGSMVSDVFLISRKLLTGAKVPKWIVYGIAPRDLLDNLLSKETRTPIFERLFSLEDMWREKSNFTMSLNEKVDLVIEKFCFLYSDRGTIQRSLADTYHRWKRRSLNLFGRPSSREQPPLGLLSFKNVASNKNIAAYRERYKNFQPIKFNKQKAFLKALCEESSKKGTNVLLVNMPLTQKIINLMPSEAYDAYNQTLKEMDKIPGVAVLDLQVPKQFPGNLFGDLVHLNAQGGHLLNRLIADKLLAYDKKQVALSKSPLILKDQNEKKIANRSINSDSNTTNTEIDGIASWWLTKAYFAEPKPPEIVILGSSQLWPVLGADAYVYNKPVDITGNHCSRVIEYDLHALLNKNWRVFIGALPRAMISDQLVISRALFSKQYKPKLVAITFSPRDFIDHCFPSEKSTEAFAFFSQYTDPFSLRRVLDKIRTDKYHFKQTYSYDSEAKSLFALGEPFERLCPGENIICAGQDSFCEDNTEEYRQRYQKALSLQLNTQMNYFDSLLEYLAKQHIQVVAFNMPISAANRALLPKNFWKYYDDRISEICKKNGADFISADQVVLPFEENELIDGIHMNLAGGLRWTRVLAVYIANKILLGRRYQELLHDKSIK